MKGKNKMKKIISVVLMFVLLLGCVGGVVEGPESMAAWRNDFGTIGMKMTNFDAAGEDYNDVSSATLYEDDTVCLFFKRKTGCRIPKGSYVRVFYTSEYQDLRDDNLDPHYADKHGYTVRYQSRKLAKNSDQIAWYWNKPWKPGNYTICLIMPYTDYKDKTRYCFMKWQRKIKRYG